MNGVDNVVIENLLNVIKDFKTYIFKKFKKNPNKIKQQ